MTKDLKKQWVFLFALICFCCHQEKDMLRQTRCPSRKMEATGGRISPAKPTRRESPLNLPRVSKLDEHSLDQLTPIITPGSVPSPYHNEWLLFQATEC